MWCTNKNWIKKYIKSFNKRNSKVRAKQVLKKV